MDLAEAGFRTKGEERITSASKNTWAVLSMNPKKLGATVTGYNMQRRLETAYIPQFMKLGDPEVKSIEGVLVDAPPGSRQAVRVTVIHGEFWVFPAELSGYATDTLFDMTVSIIGMDNHIAKLGEECNELALALRKLVVKRGDGMAVAGEIADVEILLESVKKRLDLTKEVAVMRESKLERHRSRLTDVTFHGNPKLLY